MKILEAAVSGKRIKEGALKVIGHFEARGRYEKGKQDKKIKV